MVRLSFIVGLATAFALVIGSFADAGFGHHRRQHLRLRVAAVASPFTLFK